MMCRLSTSRFLLRLYSSAWWDFNGRINRFCFLIAIIPVWKRYRNMIINSLDYQKKFHEAYGFNWVVHYIVLYNYNVNQLIRMRVKLSNCVQRKSKKKDCDSNCIIDMFQFHDLCWILCSIHSSVYEISQKASNGLEQSLRFPDESFMHCKMCAKRDTNIVSLQTLTKPLHVLTATFDALCDTSWPI